MAYLNTYSLSILLYICMVSFISSTIAGRGISNMALRVEKVSGPNQLGEGPHWDQDKQALFFVDALASKIGRFLPSENRTTLCKVDSSEIVSIVIPMKDTTDKFLVTIGSKLAEVTWDGESPEPQNIKILTAIAHEPGKEGTRFNDGKMDPFGRLWVGTMGNLDSAGNFPQGVGSLYSFSKDLTVRKHVDGLTIANGLAWSGDGKTMYYIDTPTKRIDAFDYDVPTGNITNRRTIFDFSKALSIGENEGPDGMTIDSDGNLWVAVFGAAGVFHINPRSGELMRKVDIPSLQTTSVAFGGPNLDELYVVSANFNLPESVTKKFPDVGCTFRVTGLGVHGLPMHPAYFSS